MRVMKIGKVYDNGGKTFDRYTVEIICRDGSSYWIGAGPTGNVPNGFFMTVSRPRGTLAGKQVNFESLPERLQADLNHELERRI